MLYIRSRNAEGDEGTDFARSQRQQNLILALKKRVLSPEFFLHPQKTLQLVKILEKITETDISEEDYAFIGKLIIKTDFAKIKTLNLEEFLINPPLWQYGQWVLVPRTGDFKEIQELVKGQIPE